MIAACCTVAPHSVVLHLCTSLRIIHVIAACCTVAPHYVVLHLCTSLRIPSTIAACCTVAPHYVVLHLCTPLRNIPVIAPSAQSQQYPLLHIMLMIVALCYAAFRPRVTLPPDSNIVCPHTTPIHAHRTMKQSNTGRQLVVYQADASLPPHSGYRRSRSPQRVDSRNVHQQCEDGRRVPGGNGSGMPAPRSGVSLGRSPGGNGSGMPAPDGGVSLGSSQSVDINSQQRPPRKKATRRGGGGGGHQAHKEDQAIAELLADAAPEQRHASAQPDPFDWENAVEAWPPPTEASAKCWTEDLLAMGPKDASRVICRVADQSSKINTAALQMLNLGAEASNLLLTAYNAYDVIHMQRNHLRDHLISLGHTVTFPDIHMPITEHFDPRVIIADKVNNKDIIRGFEDYNLTEPYSFKEMLEALPTGLSGTYAATGEFKIPNAAPDLQPYVPVITKNDD